MQSELLHHIAVDLNLDFKVSNQALCLVFQDTLPRPLFETVKIDLEKSKKYEMIEFFPSSPDINFQGTYCIVIRNSDIDNKHYFRKSFSAGLLKSDIPFISTVQEKDYYRAKTFVMTITGGKLGSPDERSVNFNNLAHAFDLIINSGIAAQIDKREEKPSHKIMDETNIFTLTFRFPTAEDKHLEEIK